MIGASNPSASVLVINLICLTTINANTKYIPSRIRAAILTTNHIDIPKIGLIIIFIFYSTLEIKSSIIFTALSGFGTAKNSNSETSAAV